MSSENIFVRLSTLGPIGYLPASGTMATIVTLFFIYFLSFFSISSGFYIAFLLLFIVISMKIIGISLNDFKKRDPSEIVLDEVVGCFIVFCCVPISFFSMWIGFLVFRFFDVFKPLGIRHCENLYGSLGVMMDDIISGILANIVLQLLFYYWV